MNGGRTGGIVVGQNHPDFHETFNFLLTIEGIGVAGFSECTGLGWDSEIRDYQEGANRTLGRTSTAGNEMSNIILKQGYTQSKLWKWWQDVRAGKDDRRSGAITLRDEMGNEIIRWTFCNGWPSKCAGLSADPKSEGFAIEELGLILESLVLSE